VVATTVHIAQNNRLPRAPKTSNTLTQEVSAIIPFLTFGIDLSYKPKYAPSSSHTWNSFGSNQQNENLDISGQSTRSEYGLLPHHVRSDGYQSLRMLAIMACPIKYPLDGWHYANSGFSGQQIFFRPSKFC